MRKAINENPLVQVGLLGVLLVIVAFLMMTRVMGGDETAADPAASATGASVPVNGAEAVPGATAPPAAAAPAPVGSTSSTSGSVSPQALIPGPGLPAEVVSAWKSGKAIVLLIAKPSSTDDRLVRSSVRSLSGDSRLAVFVAPAGDVARYSRITQGVGVNRVPALVVVRPRSVSGPVPEAQVSYGFRNSQGVVQAVDDALYEGRDDVPYHPG